jgi:hypothetical protein
MGCERFDIGMKRDGQDDSDEGVGGGIRPIYDAGSQTHRRLSLMTFYWHLF